MRSLYATNTIFVNHHFTQMSQMTVLPSLYSAGSGGPRRRRWALALGGKYRGPETLRQALVLPVAFSDGLSRGDGQDGIVSGVAGMSGHVRRAGGLAG